MKSVISGLTRRSFMSGVAATATALNTGSAFAANAPTLRSVAESKALLYGAAVRSDMLASDGAYSDLVGGQALNKSILFAWI